MVAGFTAICLIIASDLYIPFAIPLLIKTIVIVLISFGAGYSVAKIHANRIAKRRYQIELDIRESVEQETQRQLAEIREKRAQINRSVESFTGEMK